MKKLEHKTNLVYYQLLDLLTEVQDTKDELAEASSSSLWRRHRRLQARERALSRALSDLLKEIREEAKRRK